jgi:multidrug efflux pump subunit AcrA (membrane-fusion protein)
VKLSRLLAPVCLACLMVAAHAADGTPVRVPTVVVGNAAASTAMTLDAVLQPVRQATVTAQVGGNVLACGSSPATACGAASHWCGWTTARCAPTRRAAMPPCCRPKPSCAMRSRWLERNRALKKDGFISQAAVDNADNQVQAAQAAVRQAQAARTQATVAQGFADLVAPFDAVVLATHVETGDLAMPGRALVTLYEPGRMRAVAQVSASRAAIAGAATEVMVVLADGQSFTPSARELLPTADPVSQTVEWRLTASGQRAALRPGPDRAGDGALGRPPRRLRPPA